MSKENKIEFRCSTALKRRLIALRPLLGVTTLSAVSRRLIEIAIENQGIQPLERKVPALNEAAHHLDRLASALQRSLLNGRLSEEARSDLSAQLSRVEDLLAQINRR